MRLQNEENVILKMYCVIKKNHNKIDIYIRWRMCLLGKYFPPTRTGNLTSKYMHEKKMLYTINK